MMNLLKRPTLALRLLRIDIMRKRTTEGKSIRKATIRAMNTTNTESINPTIRNNSNAISDNRIPIVRLKNIVRMNNIVHRLLAITRTTRRRRCPQRTNNRTCHPTNKEPIKICYLRVFNNHIQRHHRNTTLRQLRSSRQLTIATDHLMTRTKLSKITIPIRVISLRLSGLRLQIDNRSTIRRLNVIIRKRARIFSRPLFFLIYSPTPTIMFIMFTRVFNTRKIRRVVIGVIRPNIFRLNIGSTIPILQPFRVTRIRLNNRNMTIPQIPLRRNLFSNLFTKRITMRPYNIGVNMPLLRRTIRRIT